ncbi:Zinc finger protein CONSTANS-LIKE 9 [Camellia lanceoleosa]|uniref:Zinc finger protein CONSTANS-LIKE 9 n=1 Tax=Camellia lanceoleosa TaxID=1840588 RepID=A0ACC0I878_9ERIC|nr:Zinc finger protein CONSTANS-LIKE 9 [Camellia lanceoleosa]
MNEVDLNIENYEEIFGVALNDPEQLFGNDGIGCLLGVKDMSDADLNHRGTYAPEIIKTGDSPMVLMGEPPPLCPESLFPSTSRSSAGMRYMEKKKTLKQE